MNRFPPQGGVTPAQLINSSPATNEITNGNFNNDLTGWSHPGAVAIADGAGLIGSKAALMSPTSYTWLNRSESVNCSAGDILYARCWFKVAQTASNVGLSIRSSNSTVEFGAKFFANQSRTSEEWVSASVIAKAITPGYQLYFYVYSLDSPAPKAQVYADGFLSLNLTKIFGRGNEPSELEMDDMLTKFPNSFFDGAAKFPLISSKDVYNLIAQERYKSNFELMEDFNGMFKALDRVYTDYSSTWINLVYTDIYALYDALETTYPTYVSHTVEAIITPQDLGDCEIRKYTFKPVQTRGGIDTLPKVIIVAGLHGEEKMGILSLYNMMADICNNWKNDDRLRFLRHNIEFIVYPCVNIWGVNNNTRKNHNGVDLNRNFPINWILGADPSATTYGGASALSETETECIHNTVDSLKDTAILFVDFHNYSTPLEATDCTWISCPTKEMKLMATNYIRAITGFWQKEYPSDILQTDVVFGYVDGGDYGAGTAASNADNIGVLGVTVEVGPVFPNQASTTAYDVISQKRHQELITNFILQCIRKLII
jgi:hypothetical protein